MIIFSLDGVLASCSKDAPIEYVSKVFRSLVSHNDIFIWTNRDESLYQRTYDWLWGNHIQGFIELKMRPIGNTEPEEVLKERWLDERCNSIYGGRVEYAGKPAILGIDFVFESHGPSIEMWKRRGIFVFDCRQNL